VGRFSRDFRVLLDDQVAAERRPASLVRLRKYAGLEPGYTPLADGLRKLTELQLAKPNMIYPSKASVETALSRNALYVDGSPTFSSDTNCKAGRNRTRS